MYDEKYRTRRSTATARQFCINAFSRAASCMRHLSVCERALCCLCTFIKWMRFYQTFVDFMPNKSLILPNWNYITVLCVYVNCE